mgnify:CR=1 FL=1
MPKMPKEEIKSQTKELITKDTFSMGMICLTNPILQHLQVWYKVTKVIDTKDYKQ